MNDDMRYLDSVLNEDGVVEFLQESHQITVVEVDTFS